MLKVHTADQTMIKLRCSPLTHSKSCNFSPSSQEIEDTFKLHRKDLLTYEFAVLVSLEFSLHIPDKEAYTHYQRLLYIS